jgi:hypothetical protein
MGRKALETTTVVLQACIDNKGRDGLRHMKRGLLNAMLVLLFGLSVWVGVVPMASAKGGIDFGVDYHTWTAISGRGV